MGAPRQEPIRQSQETDLAAAYAEIDLARTGPATPGGRFMRRFWIAVHRSQDLPKGKAKPIRIMSEDFTLYRGESGEADELPTLGF
jgi:hypothetical protein